MRFVCVMAFALNWGYGQIGASFAEGEGEGEGVGCRVPGTGNVACIWDSPFLSAALIVADADSSAAVQG